MQYWKRIFVMLLFGASNAAVQRGDNIALATDPAVHTDLIESLQLKNPNISSRYLDLELPILNEMNVEPSASYPAKPAISPSR